MNEAIWQREVFGDDWQGAIRRRDELRAKGFEAKHGYTGGFLSGQPRSDFVLYRAPADSFAA